MAGVERQGSSNPNGKTGGRGGIGLPDGGGGETIDAMMNGGGDGPRNPTIVRCCTSSEAPQCHLFCEGAHILLPLPVKIQSSTGVKWNNVDSGKGGQITTALSGMWHTGNFKQAAATAFNDFKSEFARTKLSHIPVEAALDNMDFVFAHHGIAVLPAKELQFDGIDFRSFNFQWKLVPLDKKDSQQIHKFIKHTQEHMLPDMASGIVGYPDLWAINWKQSDQGLPIIKDSYVKQIDVDYSAAGQYSFMHKDNEPVAFLISVSFVEATIFCRQDVKAGIYG